MPARGESPVNADRRAAPGRSVHRGLTDRDQTPGMIRCVLFALGVLAAVALWLGSRPAVPKPYVKAYHQALAQHPGHEAGIEAGLSEFEAVYGDLTHPRIGARIAALYAEELYFNDSLTTFRQREALVDYMVRTSRELAQSEVRIESIARAGADVYVRWSMRFHATAMGRKIESESIGMSHLRFDEQGRIVVHQDFWDAAGGVYRHLPVVGYGLDLVDRRMAASKQR